MKVSSKGHYGLLALAELANHYRLQRAVQLKEIAEHQGIPEQYLGQIMALLKRGELVHGARGPTGGYTLARAPESITVKEVLQVIRDNKWPIQATIEFEYPVPAGSDRMTELKKCIDYCRAALA